MEIRTKEQSRIKHIPRRGTIPENHLTIRIPNSRVLRVIARSVLLALAIVTFPWIGSFMIGTSSNSYNPIDFATLPMLFQDLTNEGLFKFGEKSLFVTGSGRDHDEKNIGLQILNDNEMDLISESDFERQSSIPDDTFNFVFTTDFKAAQFIDRTLKIGGIVGVQLSDNPSNAFQKYSNYKIVYLRRFRSTIVALRKTGLADTSMMNSSTKRRLCSFTSEAKKAALKGLEDVLLEPPRGASEKSDNYLERTRTKYLPDLMGDSLIGYSRRVFIDVRLPGNTGSSNEWFEQNYPTRNRDFKMYKIDMVTEELWDKTVPQLGMSEWLWKNVKEEEYVVMRAEAEVVEEMMSSKAICLVDELFLECNVQGQGGRKDMSRRRAYWECLALYGRLMDEGVAVHQWWG